MVLSLISSQLFKSLDLSVFRTTSTSKTFKSLLTKLSINNYKPLYSPTYQYPRKMASSQGLFRLTANSPIEDYLQANKEWATSANNEVLKSNAVGQSPHTLWIGCSDSRCSEFALKNLQPGEVFTHRNIANILNNPADPSSRAIIKFAVNVLKVKKILITGHTKCGGASATLQVNNEENYYDTKEVPKELVDWLTPLIDLKFKHKHEFEKLADADEVTKNRKLVELNIKHQVEYVESNQDVQNAIKEGRLEVHGLLYNVDNGLLELIS